MASKKKEITIADVLVYFKEILKRSNLTNFIFVNTTLISTTNGNVFIEVEPDLWNAIIDDTELKPYLRELNIKDDNERMLQTILTDIDINGIWNLMNPEKLYNKEIIEIDHGDKLPISINKDFFPLRLKKIEFEEMYYKVNKDKFRFYIKKTFKTKLENTSFSMIKIYQIL